jgi:hypothetical protein
MLPVIKRMAVLPPVRTAKNGTDFDAIEIDTDAELQGLGVAEIVSAGGENIYMKQDGLLYFAKIYATDKFGPGMHDFSEESFAKVCGNKFYAEFSDDNRTEFFVVKCAVKDQFEVKWLDAGDNYSVGIADSEAQPLLEDAISCAQELSQAYNQAQNEKKQIKMGM